MYVPYGLKLSRVYSFTVFEIMVKHWTFYDQNCVGFVQTKRPSKKFLRSTSSFSFSVVLDYSIKIHNDIGILTLIFPFRAHRL